MLTALALAGAGCASVQSWFSPQQEVAELCTQVEDKNALDTCTSFLKLAITDAANLGTQRYLMGDLNEEARRALADRLQQLADSVRVAESLFATGDVSNAEGQLRALHMIVLNLERRAKE